MLMDDYQKRAYKAIQPHGTEKDAIAHWTIGLTEEAGEVANVVKHKYYCGEPIPVTRVAEELGDLLWYLSAICTEYGISLSDVAELNLAKLEHRYGGADEFDPGRSQERHRLMEAFESTPTYLTIVSKMQKEAGR